MYSLTGGFTDDILEGVMDTLSALLAQFQFHMRFSTSVVPTDSEDRVGPKILPILGQMLLPLEVILLPTAAVTGEDGVAWDGLSHGSSGVLIINCIASDRHFLQMQAVRLS